MRETDCQMPSNIPLRALEQMEQVPCTRVAELPAADTVPGTASRKG